MKTIDQYLLFGRADKNRLIKKLLVRLIKYIHQRSLNPLNPIDYPDPIAEDLSKMMQMCIRVVDWIEKHPNGTKYAYQQLEFTWIGKKKEIGNDRTN